MTVVQSGGGDRASMLRHPSAPVVLLPFDGCQQLHGPLAAAPAGLHTHTCSHAANDCVKQYPLSVGPCPFSGCA